MRHVAERIREVVLAPADGEPFSSWTPGSHVDVTLGPDLVRQYSLCSSPEDHFWRLAVLEELDSRGGSRFVHNDLHVGDELTVSGPTNNFELRISARRLIFVAGGIGLTPILPMVAAADRAAADWRMLHLSRSPASAAYLDELGEYGARVIRHVDTDGGPIDLVSTLDGLEGSESDIYACGPRALLDAVEAYASQRDHCQLVVERFTNDQASLRDGDHAFVVETADGTEVEVAADRTILEALTEVGIRVLSSCQEGVCGTCETTVLEGIPDHRDAVLSDDERAAGDTMMICVSRCVGRRLVLDV